jgi:hypothetical protein
MQFRARLNKISHIHQTWRGSSAPSGALGPVVFRWVPPGLYLSDVLSADELVVMQAHPQITIEAVAHAVPTGSFTEPADPEHVKLAPAAFRRKRQV